MADEPVITQLEASKRMHSACVRLAPVALRAFEHTVEHAERFISEDPGKAGCYVLAAAELLTSMGVIAEWGATSERLTGEYETAAQNVTK